MFRHEKVFAMERNCIVGQKSYNKPFFSSLIRNFVTPIIESVPKPARITPYPTGRLFWGGAVPGTSCQATIAPSLRDISQQALANTQNLFATSRTRLPVTAMDCHPFVKCGYFVRETGTCFSLQPIDPVLKRVTRGSEQPFPLIRLEFLC